jgi:hypothetical protein
VFIFSFQSEGINYVKNFAVSCAYFALIIFLLYETFGEHLKARANNFSLKEIGIASVLIAVSVYVYWILNHFVISLDYGSIRNTLAYPLQIKNSFLITKAFEIMFQQAFFIISIDYLFKNQLKTSYDIIIFGFYSFLIHLPIIFILDSSLAWVILFSSFAAGMLFSYCIIKYKNGFLYSYIIHYSFYVLIGVVYWLYRTNSFSFLS